VQAIVKNVADAGEKSASKYRIKFAVNGGKRLAADSRSKFVTSGSKYGKLPSPKRKGYKFTGWYTKKKGGARIRGAATVKTKKPQTLYAHWKRK
jgi:uncharacterized repeat protein (TIGR02543 family)